MLVDRFKLDTFLWIAKNRNENTNKNATWKMQKRTVIRRMTIPKTENQKQEGVQRWLELRPIERC